MSTKRTKTIGVTAVITATLLLLTQPWADKPQTIPAPTPLIAPVDTVQIDEKPELETAQTTKVVDNESTSEVLPPLVEKTIPKIQQDGRLIDKLDELIAQYKQGSLDAGYLIALNLKYCLDAPTTPEALEKLLQEHNEARHDNYVTSEQERFTYCEGVSLATRQSHYTYLEELIDKKYPPAQEHFSNLSPPYMLTDSFKQLSEKEKQAHYKAHWQKANQLLLESAEGGNLLAVLYLSTNYQSGYHIEKDLVKALSYNIALLDLTTDSGIHNTFSERNQKLRQSLSTTELELAIENSQNIIRKINRNGKLYRFP